MTDAIKQILTPIIKLRGLIPISTDVIVLAGIFFVFFFYALYFGRNRVISLIFAFYRATFLYQIFPYIDKLIILQGDKFIVLNKLAIFLIFFLPLNIIINRYIFAESGHSGASHIFRITGFSLCCLVLFMLFSYNIINLNLFYNFSPTIGALFIGTTRLFLWNLAPLALLTIL